MTRLEKAALTVAAVFAVAGMALLFYLLTFFGGPTMPWVRQPSLEQVDTELTQLMDDTALEIGLDTSSAQIVRELDDCKWGWPFSARETTGTRLYIRYEGLPWPGEQAALEMIEDAYTYWEHHPAVRDGQVWLVQSSTRIKTEWGSIRFGLDQTRNGDQATVHGLELDAVAICIF